MIFRQLFESLSCTYTYLLGDEQTGRAVLVDPVISSMDRDLAEIRRLGLTLACTLDTHIHALPYPRLIDHAVPGNRQCGVCPQDLPENLAEYCRRMSDSPQG